MEEGKIVYIAIDLVTLKPEAVFEDEAHAIKFCVERSNNYKVVSAGYYEEVEK